MKYIILLFLLSITVSCAKSPSIEVSSSETQNADLVAICTMDYNPVCGKQPNAGVVCITTPCETDRYLTFSNTCQANVAKAWIAIKSECIGLEGVISEHIKPVLITDIKTTIKYSDTFNVLASSIDGDILTLEFEVSGGCGTHEFDLMVNDSFAESMPVQLSNRFYYKNNDKCNNSIKVIKSFDLKPISEIYKRAYTNAKGTQLVNLLELGVYSFVN